ncbi:MAG: fused MFS/spermidine synthase [Candidatus Dormibacteraeota bacterium]|nr:fused MFS/spermidine synthase [Candidatus Dormibacteraeota bacterium]
MGSFPEEGRRRHADRLVVCAFVTSGAAGLMYQVVWSRELVLVFGNTTEAIGTIVSAFMAGLGLGGLVGGLVSPRLRRPLLLYGLVEVAVGGSALLVPAGLHLVAGVYRQAYDAATPGELTLVRLALTLATVTPVTFLMGLTLPLLTRHLVISMRTAGARMGQLYSANTLGAMAGTLLSGIILIELFGLSVTADTAVGLNVLAGGIALALVASEPVGSHVAMSPGLNMKQPAQIPGLRRLLYAATFVSGFVALALEVLWTRMLAEGTGSLIYIFVVILAVYLLGIAVGGAAYRAASSPSRDTPRVLALALLGIAVGTLVTVPLGTVWISTSPIWRAIILLPATICMGYAFPLSARLLTRDPAHGSRSIGVLYAWNTAGSILGSLAAAFVLAGALGTNASILVLAGANATTGLVLLVTHARPLRRLSLRMPLGAVAVIVIPLLLAATGSPVVKTSTEHRLDAGGFTHYHAEDRLSTLDAVAGPPSERRLFVTGTSMTYLSTDTKLMAYLPKVMRPNANDFLDIAFGMGTTYRSAINLRMRTDAVDLSPTVPRMMPVFYADAEKYLNNPLGRVVTADGRNYVRLTSRRYDIISVDPPPPIRSAGTVVLYTREFYADAHRHLRRDGLMTEWLYFGVNLAELREHLHTFRSEFPHVLVLISPMHGGLYLLGSDSDISWDPATASRILASPDAMRDIGDAPDYYRIAGRSWPSILASMQWLKDGEVDRFSGDAPLITDDHPRTEYYLLHKMFASGDQSVTEARLRKLGP